MDISKPQPDAAPAPPAPVRESLSAFSVRVGEVYDGPLDLLLDLIRKQDIDIRDIPIARITSQYLLYIERMDHLDVEVASEFLLMASTLIQIKSRMLLPAAPLLPGETAEDPREELVRRLLEYEQFKKAAEMLHERQQLEDASWPRPVSEEFAGDLSAEPELAVSIYDLSQAFQMVLRRFQDRPQLEILAEDVSVADALRHLHRCLLASDQPLKVRELFAAAPSRRVLVTMFIALLELVRLQAVIIRQERMFGEILLRKDARFAQVMPAVEGLIPAAASSAPAGETRHE